MATFKRFEDIQAWQKARLLDQVIFTLTNQSAFSRDFKLIDQWRGASGSIMDNIAEGFDREGTREFIQFLSISKGSTGEVRSQAYRAMDRGYISQSEFEEVYNKALEIKNMISKLMDYLKQSDLKGIKYKTD